MNSTKTRITIRQGDLIAALYDEVMKETKEKRIQSLMVGLALLDLKVRRAAPGKVLARKSHSPR